MPIRGSGGFASGVVVATVDGHDTQGLAAPDGTFVLNNLGNLSQGAHTVTVHNVDDNIESGPSSASRTFYWLPPITLTAPSNHAINPGGAPVSVAFSGAKGGATVRLYESGNPTAVAAATASGGGSGTLSINPVPSDGPHQYSATQDDNATHVSSASASVGIDIDTAAPDAPTIQFPTDGQLINQSQPTFIYAAEPLANVAYEVDGSSYAPQTASSGGTVELSVAVALAEGHHTIRAKSTDAAGNASPWSPLTGFDVDSIAPTDLDLLSPDPLTRDNSGRWEFITDPGATATIAVNHGAPQHVTADGDGHAVFDLGTLADGEYEIDATATDAAGNPTIQTFHITIDTTGPTAPMIVSPTPGEYLSTQRPSFPVTADPRQDLALTIDGVPAGRATTNDNGQASISLADDTMLTEGPHTAIVYADDPLGNESASNAVTFIVDPNGTLRPAPPPPPVTSPGPPVSHTPLTLAMAISGVRLRGSVLSTCARHARHCKEKTATLSLSVNQAASVKLTLSHKVHGATKTVGTVTVKAARAGTVSYVLHRKFAGHALATGAYKLVVQASPKAGGSKSTHGDKDDQRPLAPGTHEPLPPGPHRCPRLCRCLRPGAGVGVARGRTGAGRRSP